MEAVSIIQILYRILKAVVESVISGFYTATTLQCYAIPQLSADTSDDGCNQRRHRIKTFIRFCLGILWPQAKLLLRTCRYLHRCHLLTSISLNKSCLVTCAWLCLLFFWWGKHKFCWAASVFSLSMLLKIIIDNWTIISPKLSLKRGIWIEIL